MSFFRRLEEMASGTAGASQATLPPHPCANCRTEMQYRGPQAIRTGGVTRGVGLGLDLLLGGGGDDFFNQAIERNVVVHVLVCPSCGEVAFVNDPRRGF